MSWNRRLGELPTSLQTYILTHRTYRQQWQSTYGYWLLQQVITLLWGESLGQVSFTESGQPIGLQSFTSFSISHSEAVVGVAISTLGRIGLDIQAYKLLSSSVASPVFFSAMERQAIEQATDTNHCLLRFWSKKEALIKAVGGTLLELGNQTDARTDQTIFQGDFFYWLSLPHPQKGMVWLASDHPFDNFSAKKWYFKY